MRIFKAITLFALLLSLPAYGLAAFARAGDCQQHASASSAAKMDHDCCPDANSSKSSSKGHGPCASCVSGDSCKNPQTSLPTQIATLIPSSVAVVFDHSALHLPAPDPDGLLRPPTLH